MTRKSFLVVLAIACGASWASAQPGPYYYPGGPYPQAAPMPAQGAYGYPAAYPAPAQGAYGYPAAYPMPAQGAYGYPAAYPAPRQPVYYQPANYYQPRSPYPMHAQHHGHAYPNYRYPSSSSPGHYNGYGVNYHYMENPMGFSATPAPYSAVANNNALGRETIIRNPLDDMPDDAVAGPDPIYPEPPSRGPAGPFHRTSKDCWWVAADYVGYFFRPMRLSGPLVSTGQPLDPAPGALGQPGTAVLLGNQNIDFGLLSGVRLEVGMFLDKENHYSLELAGFWLSPGSQSFGFAGDANGNPVISRPILNVAINREGAFVNSIPNVVTGTLAVDFRSEMGGVELNARYHDYVKERLHVEGLAGFRYLRLSEQMKIFETIQGIQPNFVTFQGQPIPLTSSLMDEDNFRTTNNFFGPQIGGRLTWEQQWFSLAAFAKLGLGVTHQETTIKGTTSLVTSNGNEVVNGGILALPSNSGIFGRTVFAILPEFGFNLGVEVTENVRVKMGYSVLLWNHVVRPGGQYDRNVNPGQVPGSTTFGQVAGPFGPIYRFNDEFFWAHSFNIGLEVHY